MSNQYVLMENINNNNGVLPNVIKQETVFEPFTNNINNNNNSNNSSGIGGNKNLNEKTSFEDSTGTSHFLLEEDFSKDSGPKFPSKYKRIFYFLASFIIIATIVLLIVFLLPRGWKPPSSKGKINVIMMIGDGMGPASLTLARRAFNLTSLNLDPYIVGTVQTFSSDSWVTDSAAAATAYGCGIKSYNGAIGVDPNRKPVGNLIEACKLKNIRTGLVVTTRISDATPSGFYAHSVSRDYEPFIISQLLEKDIDVVLGGGKQYFSKEVLQNSISKENSYQFVETRDQMLNIEKGKILGLFSDYNIPYEIDRINQKLSNIPTLAEMTTKALQLLNDNSENGFFLMVEGSKIDVAGHQNDAASQIYETKAFDDAFQVALDFAESKGNTVILVTADHETGGLTLGLQDNIAEYPVYAWNPEPLFKVNRSTDELALLLSADTSNNNTGSIISTYTGVTLTPSEIAQINNFKTNSMLRNLIGKLISKRSNIGWTTFGHTGVDVNLYAYSSLNSTVFKSFGNHNNIDISEFISETLSLDMDKASSQIEDFTPQP